MKIGGIFWRQQEMMSQHFSYKENMKNGGIIFQQKSFDLFFEFDNDFLTCFTLFGLYRIVQ